MNIMMATGLVMMRYTDDHQIGIQDMPVLVAWQSIGLGLRRAIGREGELSAYPFAAAKVWRVLFSRTCSKGSIKHMNSKGDSMAPCRVPRCTSKGLVSPYADRTLTVAPRICSRKKAETCMGTPILVRYRSTNRISTVSNARARHEFQPSCH
jgi:hypothetical protein